MNWHVALVLDETYGVSDLTMLVHQMPIWAVTTPERQSAASAIRQGAGELWFPEPAFTLFTPASFKDKEETCRNILGTVLEHHVQLACLELIGILDSEALRKVMQTANFKAAERSFHEGVSFHKPIQQSENVRELILDARNWRTADDFYDSFFEAVGAPAWHGRNFDALHDSIVTGDINQIEVPYRIRIREFSQMGPAAHQVANQFVTLIQRFERTGCPVSVTLENERS